MSGSTQRWQEYRGDTPPALAGLGATPVHHDGAWWVRQPNRTLVYPTGTGKAFVWPGVAGHDPRATPDAQKWALAGHDPHATPHDQKWALAGGRDVDSLSHDVGGHNPSATPHDQKWALAAAKQAWLLGGHDPHATPDAQKWALAGHNPSATPHDQKWALAGAAAGMGEGSPSGWQILQTPEQRILAAGSGPGSWHYALQQHAKYSQLSDGHGWRTWHWQGTWYAEKSSKQGLPPVYYKHDGSKPLAGPPRGLGDASALAQAASDLANQVALPIQAGDTYLGAGDLPAALSAYKAAGQTAATTSGPQINSAEGGAATVTKPFTDFAWGLNGQLAAATDATAAQGLAHEMLVTYQDAIENAQQALANPTPTGGPSQALLDAARALKAWMDANGVPSSKVQVTEVGNFQSAYLADGNPLKYGADKKYGPVTAAALASVLGGAPAPKPSPPGPGPGPKPGPVTPVAPSSSSSSSGDYTVPILVGAGVLAASIVALAVYKKRGGFRKRHAHAHA
jgi:hypothetical protein